MSSTLALSMPLPTSRNSSHYSHKTIMGLSPGSDSPWSRPTHLIHIVVALTQLAGVLHNGLEMGEPLPDLQHLVQLLLVLHNTHVGLAVVKDVLAGLRRVCLVDTNTESPGGGGGRGMDLTEELC